MSTTQFIGKPIKQTLNLDPKVYFSNGSSAIGFMKNILFLIYEDTQEEFNRKQQLKIMREL